jgi:hypothetical protein
VHTDGSVRLLKLASYTPVSVRGKAGRERGKVFSIPYKKWIKADPFMLTWARRSKVDVEPFLISLFVSAANIYEAANSSVIRITASKGDLSVAFGVNVKRTPYFFKDREVSMNKAGSRRRIFHIVRAHTRRTGAAVKFHFRGERSFFWNGYSIHITVPGRDHINITEFNVGSIDSEVYNKEYKVINTKELGSMWAKHIQSGKPLFQRSA